MNERETFFTLSSVLFTFAALSPCVRLAGRCFTMLLSMPPAALPSSLVAAISFVYLLKQCGLGILNYTDKALWYERVIQSLIQKVIHPRTFLLSSHPHACGSPFNNQLAPRSIDKYPSSLCRARAISVMA